MTKAGETNALEPCTANRLLIADDERAIRKMMLDVLTCGHDGLPSLKVDLAVNGAEAVESFRSLHHQVVLMDLQMPVMDGVLAFRAIVELCGQNGWQMPSFIFITGFDPPPDLDALVRAASTHCLLRKPISRQDLFTALQNRLSR